MNILILAEKKKKVQNLLNALNESKNTTYLRLSKVVLVSKNNRTRIKAFGTELEEYDAIYIQARTSLSPFIEPLLEEIEQIGNYTNIKKGSYYIGENEPYLTVVLSQAEIPIPKSISTGSVKNIESIAKKIQYPLIIKTFFIKKPQQVLLVNSQRELKLFIKSIKTEIDGFLIREFIQGDIISCAVIGEKIFPVKRKSSQTNSKEIEQGKKYKLNQKEREIILKTLKTIGYDIARIDLVKGKIIKVEPIIPFEEFRGVYTNQIELQLANHLTQKALEHEANKISPYDFLGIRKFLSKTFFAPLIKHLTKIWRDKQWKKDLQ